MKSSKKGADISLNVIIVAAIALIVLVVLVMIFTGRMSIFNKGITSTDVKCLDADKRPGAQVAAATAGCQTNYQQVVGAFTDVAADQICCVPQ
jgi:hypothetical protein